MREQPGQASRNNPLDRSTSGLRLILLSLRGNHRLPKQSRGYCSMKSLESRIFALGIPQQNPIGAVRRFRQQMPIGADHQRAAKRWFVGVDL